MPENLNMETQDGKFDSEQDHVDRLTNILDLLCQDYTTESNKPNYQGLVKTKNDNFSGDASQYSLWRQKFFLSHENRNLSNVYKAQAFHNLLRGEAREAVDIFISTKWDDSTFDNMTTCLDQRYGNRHIQARCIQDKLLLTPTLELMSLQTLQDFYGVVTVQVTYYTQIQPEAIELPDSPLYTQVRAKISDDIFMKFVEWKNDRGYNSTLIILQKWLLRYIRIDQEVELTSTKKKVEQSLLQSFPLDDQKSEDDILLPQRTESSFQSDGNESSSNSDLPSPISDSKNCHATQAKVANLHTVVCKLSRGSTHEGITVIASLDTESNHTFIDKDTAVKLRLKRTMNQQIMTLSAGDKHVVVDSYGVEVRLTSLDGLITQTLTAYVMKNLTPKNHLDDWSKAKEDFSHLREIPFDPHPQEALVSLKIGLDYAYFIQQSKHKPGKPYEPIAHLTPLGWTCSRFSDLF